jgi:hypothetical protein
MASIALQSDGFQIHPLNACSQADLPHSHRDLTYPAMSAVFLELLVQFRTECTRLLPSLWCIYAVQHIVLVETFEEGVACGVALLPC